MATNSKDAISGAMLEPQRSGAQLTPPEWPRSLHYRLGARFRLRGVHVYHDFTWVSRFPTNRTQFKNGLSLATLAIDDCPEGKEPALLLTADHAAIEVPIETDTIFALVVRIDEYVRQQSADAASSYYAQRSEAKITSLAQLRDVPKESPELFGAFLDQNLTIDHVSGWVGSEPSRLAALSQLVAPRADIEAALVFDDRTKARAISDLLSQGDSEEFWSSLADKDPGLATKLAAARIELDRQTVIEEYRAAIATHPSDERFWESFFKGHPWALQLAFAMPVFKLGDETYLGGKGPVGSQGQGGIATDFLFSDESTKSFAVVEIKTPSTPLMGGIYRGKRGSGHDQEVYGASSDLSGAVVQTRNQIAVAVDDFDAVLRRSFDDMRRVHASGVLVIGLAESLGDRQLVSFNLFRRGLHNLTVITYDELLGRLEILFGDSVSRADPSHNPK